MPSLRDLWRQLAQPRARESRAALIDRKATVQAEAAALRREIAQSRGSSSDAGRTADLEARLNALLTEERRLRLEIDRSRDPDR